MERVSSACDGQLSFEVALTSGVLERDIEVMVSTVNGPLTAKGMDPLCVSLEIALQSLIRNRFWISLQ